MGSAQILVKMLFTTSIQYLKLLVNLCQQNPKFVSTILLVLVTVTTFSVAIFTKLPYYLLYSQTTTNKNDDRIKLVDFDLRPTQLEWVLLNCGLYACVEELCYCQFRKKFPSTPPP